MVTKLNGEAVRGHGGGILQECPSRAPYNNVAQEHPASCSTTENFAKVPNKSALFFGKRRTRDSQPELLRRNRTPQKQTTVKPTVSGSKYVMSRM